MRVQGKGGRARVFAAAYGEGMLIAFSVAPTVAADDTGSVSDAVARAIRVVRDSGLPHRTDAMFTTIEGEWDECMAVVKQCCDVLARPRPVSGSCSRRTSAPAGRASSTASSNGSRTHWVVSRMTDGGWRLRPLRPRTATSWGACTWRSGATPTPG